MVEELNDAVLVNYFEHRCLFYVIYEWLRYAEWEQIIKSIDSNGDTHALANRTSVFKQNPILFHLELCIWITESNSRILGFIYDAKDISQSSIQSASAQCLHRFLSVCYIH